MPHYTESVTTESIAVAVAHVNLLLYYAYKWHLLSCLVCPHFVRSLLHQGHEGRDLPRHGSGTSRIAPSEAERARKQWEDEVVVVESMATAFPVLTAQL